MNKEQNFKEQNFTELDFTDKAFQLTVLERLAQLEAITFTTTDLQAQEHETTRMLMFKTLQGFMKSIMTVIQAAAPMLSNIKVPDYPDHSIIKNYQSRFDENLDKSTGQIRKLLKHYSDEGVSSDTVQ